MKNKPALILLAGFIFCGVLVNYLYRIPGRHYCDFRVYYKAGQDVLQGKNIYVRETQAITPFKYSPFFAFAFVPLSLLPIKAAASVFLAINFICMVLLFYLSFHLPSDFVLFRKFTDKECYWIYALLFVCVCRYMFLVWEEGQVTIIISVLVLMALSSLAKNREAAAGAFLACAILIKYTPAIFLPYFLFIRKPKVVLWAVVFTAVFLALPALLVGVAREWLYLTSWIPSIIGTSLDTSSYIDYKNQSIFSLILRLLAPTPYKQGAILSFSQAMHMAYIMAVFLYLPVFLPSRIKPGSPVVDFLLIIICTVLFNPNCWMINFIALTSTFAFLIQYIVFNKGGDWLTLAGLVCGYFLMNAMPRTLVGNSMENISYTYSFTTVGVLVLFFTLLRIKFFVPAKEALYA